MSVELVEQFGRRPGQHRSRVQVDALVTVGNDDDARRFCGLLNEDVLDLVSGALELSCEKLDHLLLRWQSRGPQRDIRCHGELLVLSCTDMIWAG